MYLILEIKMVGLYNLVMLVIRMRDLGSREMLRLEIKGGLMKKI